MIQALTWFHVLVSLVAIAAGLVVLWGLLTSRWLENWTTVFLGLTAATSVTGFLFPIHGMTPGLVLGIVSLVALGIALPAWYRYRCAGAWRWVYVGTAVLALFLNVLVLIVIPSRREMYREEGTPCE